MSSDDKSHMTRANKEHGDRIEKTGHIGGNFDPVESVAYFQERAAYFDELYAAQKEAEAARPDIPIKITLPNGDVKEGFAYKTTPYDVAMMISKGLADNSVVARVVYTNRLEEDKIVACDEDEEASHTKLRREIERDDAPAEGELWDMTRPLVGDCNLSLCKFDEDLDAKTVFWHSSSHILGAAIEKVFGAHLTIGPPLQSGFYYDSFMGTKTVHEEDLKTVETKALEVCKGKFPFLRLVVSKDQALELFKRNPFKVSLITNKVPDNSYTTVYRCGEFIDLCMGPHLPSTSRVKAFSCYKNSSTNWLGQVTNDPLQRIYGISFPEKSQLKAWEELQRKAKERDHRNLGVKQELFFFHNLSPGSAFWLPHGARVYNKLIEFIKKEYWKRGYQEVMTPNAFNLNLWETSGHAQHYKDNMFVFKVEDAEWAMKPMNCPSHCLIFAHRLRSYRELPIRMADFGVLHRNEVSGALSGLTRVRRFQQDDGHIFCRIDQIKQEVLGALNFMKYVYNIFGMTYKLELSTRPEKALGEMSLWDLAEGQLAEALNEFSGEGTWKVNPGDGAFYGPKIDIKVYDALERIHQCATVQLDFQLPIRFNLEYKASQVDGADPTDAFQRPVIIHRAMLGSVERMFAVLTEHYGGKWPLWLSPRQVIVVPIDKKYIDYAYEVQEAIHQAGFYVDVDDSHHTLNKKVREAQVQQYNFIFVVGQKEMDDKSVNIRTRDNEVQGTVSLVDAIEKLNTLVKDFK